ncbi:uroporphyrinogen-III synthase [Sphingomonas rubra]|uniref:Uroporphyrinogen-III synthase n=1 Tax=Sphingomonas rubra TaxID=634430 RepID=A0A1I5TU18_9SPHN|nr:uroporphyrinogen-III synthase [Sphingomonas rubra]SFP86391.1 uroporphyrinogen-III synthase [Sphingomonas rubra]
MTHRSVAILRPEPGNARTATRVEAAGLAAIRLPLFAVAPLAWTPPETTAYDALLATSANAFRHGGDGLAALRRLPVLAVGAATAAAACAAGFAVEATGDADAASLAARAGSRRLLHLTGRDHHPVGADVLAVYAAEPLPVAPAAVDALAGAVALLHSPRAARRLAALVAPSRRTAIAIAALSPAVAEAAGGGWRRVAAAPHPRDEALVALAVDLSRVQGD